MQKQRTKSLAAVIIAVISLLITVSGHADNSQTFQVEIIIFAQSNPHSLEGGLVPIAPQKPQTTQAIQLLLADDNPSQTYQKLLINNLVLSKEKNILQHKGYTLLVHSAWLQPTQGIPKTIHLQGGNRYGFSNSYYQLDGNIKVNKSRFYDIHLNLIYTLPQSKLPASLNQSLAYNDDQLTSFQLKKSLRTVENKLNYIDNPLFGILIKIIPSKSSQG